MFVQSIIGATEKRKALKSMELGLAPAACGIPIGADGGSLALVLTLSDGGCTTKSCKSWLMLCGETMGTITERKRGDGSTAYLAQIMRRNGGNFHRESKTFNARKMAEAWIARREKELDQPGGLAKAKAVDPTLGEAIDRYIAESRKAIGRTKAQVLSALRAMPIGETRCSELTSDRIVSLARELGEGREPQTVGNYLSHLAAVMAVARPAWGYPIDAQAMKDAAAVAKRMGLTSKSRKRERRPTVEEVAQLVAFFRTRSRRRPKTAPMDKIIAFALFSTRRLEEITRIKWADYDADGSRVVVRDMKNPGDKAGNDVRCDLPPEAKAVIEAMPRTEKEIFPYSADAISAAFTRASRVLGIEDLHFHDLRHEGVSRLFEMGWSIPHVAAVSGHRSWQSLQRYTHLRQTGDKWAAAAWLKEMTKG